MKVPLLHTAMNSGGTQQKQAVLSTWSLYFLMSLFWVMVPFMFCVWLSSYNKWYVFLHYGYNLFYKKHSGQAERFLSCGPRKRRLTKGLISCILFFLTEYMHKDNLQVLNPSILNKNGFTKNPFLSNEKRSCQDLYIWYQVSLRGHKRHKWPWNDFTFFELDEHC